MRKKIILSVIILLGCVMGYFLITRIAVAGEFRHESIPNKLRFDKQTWVKGDMRQRGQMAYYLMDSIGLVGMTKLEIQNLLGAPDDTNNITEGEYKSSISYRVDLGHTYMYDMLIYYDSTGRSKYVKIDD